jgi:hypothetical protein
MWDIKTVLELAYFVSGISLALTALYGIQQVRTVKKDLSMRVERAAKEKAIEYSGRYLTTFVPLMDAYDRDCAESKIPRYRGPIGDFSPSSIPPEYERHLKRLLLEPRSLLPAVNELNHIAAAFAYGVADDNTGFEIIGRTFCSVVASLYAVLASLRSAGSCAYWEPIVKLYRTWSARLSRTELESLRATLDKRLAGLGDTRISAIGEDR